MIWQKIVNWLTTSRVASGLLIIALLIGVLGYINQYSGLFKPIPLFEEFYANLSTELVSIALTVLVIDKLNDRRVIQQEKDALILQMGSPINSIAREAVRMLRTRDWLTNGTLRGANLRWADLQNAYLSKANLSDADLFRARLNGVHLQWSNLEGAKGLKDEQLVHLHNLRGAIMPDGTVYDGRYNLKRDLSWLQKSGIDTNDPDAIAKFYGVSVETYLSGQTWAQQNLDRLQNRAEIVQQWEFDHDISPAQFTQSPIASQHSDHQLVYLIGGFLIGLLSMKIFSEQRID